MKRDMEKFIISIHAPRGGSDWVSVRFQPLGGLFQSTLPVGGATCIDVGAGLLLLDFNPRSPWGERPPSSSRWAPRSGNFNPRSPWGERPETSLNLPTTDLISIHAPRGGSDLILAEFLPLAETISIHAPRGGSDAEWAHPVRRPRRFQSTLPVGGATIYINFWLEA